MPPSAPEPIDEAGRFIWCKLVLLRPALLQMPPEENSEGLSWSSSPNSHQQAVPSERQANLDELLIVLRTVVDMGGKPNPPAIHPVMHSNINPMSMPQP